MSTVRRNSLIAGGVAAIAGVGLVAKQLWESQKDDNKSEKTLQRLSQPLPKHYSGVKMELTDYYQNLLEELPEPRLLFKHFMTCLSTPRPSAKLDKMRAALKATADLLNIEYTQDEIGNVCLKKPASKGYEKAAGVIIQCHMDMVCTKTDDCKFDFDNDPIPAYVDGEWLKARNTTLGADDGIGVAAGLALMEHPNLIHGPIELLITVDEETNLNGAIHLAKAPFLQNKILINVDSEEPNRICIGCAGGFGKTVSVQMNRALVKNEDNAFKAYNINVSGLCGGHTGIQIHLGHANAVQLLCRILNYLILDKKIDVQLVAMSGGNASNAIPSYSKCSVIIPSKSCDAFEKSVREYWLDNILPEFKDIESKMHMDTKEINDFSFKDIKVCDAKSTQILVCVMMNLPHGVLRMSPSVEGLVQTSIAFSEMNLKRDSVEAICGLNARSLSTKEMSEVNRKLDSLGLLFGAHAIKISESHDSYPGWEPVLSSHALDHCKNAHVALYGESPDVYAVHAGLECGLIKDKYPDMDCVSIGPHIQGAHSTDEKLEIKTVGPFYEWLVETVTRIATK